MILTIYLLLTGYLGARIINKKNVTLLNIGVCFLLSTFIMAFVFYITNFVGWIFNRELVITILSLYFLLLLLIGRKSTWSFPKLTQNDLLLIPVLILFIFSFYHNLFWPISAWDSLALYDARAKFIVDNISINDLFIQTNGDVPYWGYYLNTYPPFTSYIHAVSYALNDSNIQVIYSVIWLVFLLIFNEILKEKIGKISYFATLLLGINIELYAHSEMAYTNLPYISFFVSSLLLLIKWTETNNKIYFWLSWLLVLGSQWLRMLEMMYFANILIIMIHIFRNRSWKNLNYFIVYFVTLMLFRNYWFNYVFSTIQSYGGTPGDPSSLNSIINTITHMNSENINNVVSFLTMSYNKYTDIVLVLILLFARTIISKRLSYIIVPIIFVFVIYIGGAFVINNTVGNVSNILGSGLRFMIVLYPLTFYYFGEELYRFNKNE